MPELANTERASVTSAVTTRKRKRFMFSVTPLHDVVLRVKRCSDAPLTRTPDMGKYSIKTLLCQQKWTQNMYQFDFRQQLSALHL